MYGSVLQPRPDSSMWSDESIGELEPLTLGIGPRWPLLLAGARGGAWSASLGQVLNPRLWLVSGS